MPASSWHANRQSIGAADGLPKPPAPALTFDDISPGKLMNLILLDPSALGDTPSMEGNACSGALATALSTPACTPLPSPVYATLRDARRLAHLNQVHRAAVGESFSLGIVGHGIGRGTLIRISAEEACFAIDDLSQPSPPPLPVHLVLALPRPRMLARTLEHVTALGVKQISLLHTRRVEKSYWQSPELAPDRIHSHLLLGLEQARDTGLPDVTLYKGFRPFVEQALPTLLKDRQGWLAHPGMPTACPRGLDTPGLLLVGPEGGFIEWEVEQLLAAGCQGIHLGERILRVETAVTALLARMY